MDRFFSKKIKQILNEEYNFNIYKIIDMYMDFDKSYDAYLYLKTDEELRLLTENQRKEIETIYLNCLKKYGYMPNEIIETIFYFDSDENVQKNYDGNYFYATR